MQVHNSILKHKCYNHTSHAVTCVTMNEYRNDEVVIRIISTFFAELFILNSTYYSFFTY